MTASDSESRRFSGSPGTAEKPVSVDEALRNDWLEIWYQPKIDLKRKCLAGAEALARIRHPQFGMLWPESFLPGFDEGSLAKLPIAELVAAHRPKVDDWPGLILEITEDQIVRDIAVAQRIVPELKAVGVSITIDDFGAGYSSFSSLRALSFGELKVDSTF